MSSLTLVVGREQVVVDFLAAVLQRGGLEVATATTDDAAAQSNDLDPALVLVDTYLAPVRSIRALADQKRRAVPIVVIGAETPGPTAAEDAADAGADHYVARPVADEQLVRGIRAILEAGSTGRR